MTPTSTFDPGLTQQYTGPLSRTINKDGSFNVAREGLRWRNAHLYLYLINASWPRFFSLVFLAYLGVNTLFALIYYSIGPGALQGAATGSAFFDAFFFSAQTLTTVGYGHVSPRGLASNIIAAFEAMVGVMGFAIATGLLYGRVSRPSARLMFSPRILIAPYKGGTGLQFRIANARPNVLMDLEARMLLMTVEQGDDGLKRRFRVLDLELPAVHFLPLTWTVVHPIDETSPLFGKTPEDLERVQAEVLILIRAFDDSFSQVVHGRNSYRFDEVLWNTRFTPAFHVDEKGEFVLDLQRIGDTVPAS